MVKTKNQKMFGQIPMFVEFTGKKTGWGDDDKAGGGGSDMSYPRYNKI